MRGWRLVALTSPKGIKRKHHVFGQKRIEGVCPREPPGSGPADVLGPYSAGKNPIGRKARSLTLTCSSCCIATASASNQGVEWGEEGCGGFETKESSLRLGGIKGLDQFGKRQRMRRGKYGLHSELISGRHAERKLGGTLRRRLTPSKDAQ